MQQLRLIPGADIDLFLVDFFFEQYNPWCRHINNYVSRLDLQFLYLRQQYSLKPVDFLSFDCLNNEKGIIKIHYDMYTEIIILHLVAYFDKLLSMFQALYDLNKKIQRRNKIIELLKQIEEISEIARQYESIVSTESFIYINGIRNDFVHNKSQSYYGIDVSKNQGCYSSFNSKGMSTSKTYASILEVLNSYIPACSKINELIRLKVQQKNNYTDISCD
ncbi:hypothetical protein SDC9_140557 [bioreactor metagenome]|uniref:Cthe-2314-like HEPN domain-containing protein n=1 Tax=bioreactor metagenome TaxID=1076179 RepID=A0A645DV92_9ZZZZ